MFFAGKRTVCTSPRWHEWQLLEFHGIYAYDTDRWPGSRSQNVIPESAGDKCVVLADDDAPGGIIVVFYV